MALQLGISQQLATDWLNCIRGGGAGVTYTAETNVYVQLHTAIPGAAGTNAISSVTTRVINQYAAPATGGTGLWSLAQTGTAPSWATWAGTNGEVVSHISVWDHITNATAANYLWSAALTAPKTVNTGDTFTLSSSSITLVIATT